MKLPDHLQKNFSIYPIRGSNIYETKFSEIFVAAHLAIEILGTKACGIHEVQEEGALVMLLDPHHLRIQNCLQIHQGFVSKDLLSDVLTGRPDSANCEEHIVLQEVSRKHLRTKVSVQGLMLK